jgi:hypothetical protein
VRPILTYSHAIFRQERDFSEGDHMSHTKKTHKAVQLLPSDAQDGPAAERGRRLTELANAIGAPHTFRKGQLVKWKAGLKNRGAPAYNEVAVVREVLATPVFDDCEQGRCAGSPYFGEPLNLVLAILDSDGDSFELRYDGRRFEPAES